MVFSPFSAVRAEDFLPLLNDETLRKHLIPHPLSMGRGARLDGVLAGSRRPARLPRARHLPRRHLAGWCGIQPDDEGVELAIVLAKGRLGKRRGDFQRDDGVGEELGHRTILFHLLDTARLICPSPDGPSG